MDITFGQMRIELDILNTRWTNILNELRSICSQIVEVTTTILREISRAPNYNIHLLVRISVLIDDVEEIGEYSDAR